MTIIQQCIPETIATNQKVPALISRSPCPFFIFFIPRSGSTHLISLLGSHPDIHCVGEVFHQKWRREEIDKQFFPNAESTNTRLQQLYNADIGATGFKFAFPIQHTFYPDVWDQLTSFKKNLRVICLYRENLLKQELSRRNLPVVRQIKHKSSFLFTSDPPHFIIGKQEVKTNNLFNRLKLLAERRENFFSLAQTFPNIHIVRYEDLLQSKQEAQQRILAFLGVDPTQKLESDLRKVTPDSLRDAIANYDQVCATLTGSPFEHYLDQ